MRYEEGDKLGKLLAYAALLPYVLILHHASRFYSRREVHEGVILAGLVLNEGIARGLKHLLQHPRPAATCTALNVCDSFGMPSSHTQCIVFGVALHLLLCARQWGKKSISTRLVEGAEVAALVVAAALTAASRVYLGYHDIVQVGAGAVLGLAFGAAWFGVLTLPVLEVVCASPLARFFHIRSTWHISDPVALEHGWSKVAGREKED